MIKLKSSTLKTIIVIISTTIGSLVAFVWGASAYKADYDNRLTRAEENIKNIQIVLPEIRDNVSTIKGNVQTILTIITD